MELSSGYRFTQDGKLTAVLEKDGKLILKDDFGSIEVWENWRYYVKEVMHKAPVKGEEQSILDQLMVALGKVTQISNLVHKHREPSSTVESIGKEDNMATAAKKAAKAPAKANGKANGKATAELNDCVCGCGGKTGRNFVPGHDSKVHSLEKKIAKGEVKLGSLPAITQKYIRAHANA